MRYMKLDEIQNGMILGKDIEDSNGRPLLKNGTALNSYIVSKLSERGFKRLYISDEASKNIVIEPAISQELKNDTVNSLKKLDIESTVDNAKKIVDCILSAKDIPADIIDIIDDDEKVFNHSIAVTELAVLLGKYMGYNSERLEDLAVSALLHDIGKLCINKKLMEKFKVPYVVKDNGIEMSVDEYQEQMHIVYGYSLLSSNPLVKATVKQGILGHHENEDGTGTLKLSSDKIYEYAKIIHVCDAFEHLLTTNMYCNYHIENTSEIMEFMVGKAETYFNRNIVNTFVENIPLYPPGITVLLSNGERAIIASNNKKQPTRPNIVLERFPDKIIDLTDFSTFNITILDIYKPNKEDSIGKTK